MFGNHLALGAAAAALCLSLAAPARAQFYPPPMDMSRLIAANVEFNRRFDIWTYHAAWNVARSLPPGTRVQIDPVAWSRTMAANRAAFDSYMASVRRGSDARSAAAARFSREAILGQVPYRSSYGGPTYQLPYRHNYYTILPNGTYVPGYHPNHGRVVSPYGR